MAISAYDSRVFRNLFGTQETRDVFSDDAYVRRMIEVEAALACAQSIAGVIPAGAGIQITDALEKARIDFERLSHETDIVGYPVLPLVRQLNEPTPQDVAKFIHWGATTQDIMDNASILQMKAGLTLVRAKLQELQTVLQRLSQEHRDTPMAGRTHLQHALPITFGYKCAIYLSRIERHLQRWQEIEAGCLLVQF